MMLFAGLDLKSLHFILKYKVYYNMHLVEEEGLYRYKDKSMYFLLLQYLS